MAKNLFIFSPLYSPAVGGLMNHAQEWNRHLAATGYHITVFTPLTKSGGSVEETEALHIRIFRFPAWEIIPNYHIPKFWQPRFWTYLRRAFRPTPDLIISRTRFFLTSFLAAAAARATHIPHLHVEHGSDYVQLQNSFTRMVARLYDLTLGRLTLRLADKIVANSQAGADFVKKLSGRPSQVIFRGLEISKINAILPDHRLRARYPSKILINYTGRLIDGKGLPDLLAAVHNLPPTAYQLLIIGSGPQTQALEHLATQLKIAHSVTFLGEQSREHALAVLKASDIFVNPSYTEGLPTAVAEAALCQTAIIATDVGGTREIIVNQRSGLLVAARQPKQVAAALVQLMGNQTLRRTLAEQAYASALQKFSWPTSLAAYQAIIEKLT